MKYGKFLALAVAAIVVMSASSADAGLLARLCGRQACCAPEPTCCEPAPEPCGCEEVVVEDCGCAAPEPTCGCEPACDPCDPCCRPTLLQRIRANMASRRAARCCPAPSCGC